MALVANSPQTWSIGAQAFRLALEALITETATSTRRLIFWPLRLKRVASSQALV